MRSTIVLLCGLFVSGSAVAVDTGTTGAGQPIDTMQPSLGLRWAISITGVSAGDGTGDPCAGNCYYLVSVVDDVEGEEGSLGKTSTGAERPRAAVPCRAGVDTTACN
jgi:hypothetical protein